MEFKDYTFKDKKYTIRFPDGFSEDKKYPLIFFMHGAGARGDDIEVLKTNPLFEITKKYEDFPFVIFAPLCSTNTWFDMFETIEELLKKAANLPYADETRIYGMGASMGGYGIWQLAMSLPEYFAAIAPVCGGGMHWNAGRLINVPVWAFHGALDGAVLVEESKKMVDRVNYTGGKAKLTIYEDVKHNSWVNAYSDPELFKWLLEQNNVNAKTLVDKYKGSELYG